MHAALLTVLLFAASAVAGERTARYWGSERGNLLRLAVASLLMWGLTLWWFPQTVQPASYGWLFLSGVVGFGFGDIALFLAYVRVGARLTILLNLCTAPLWGTLVEWLWLGTALGPTLRSPPRRALACGRTNPAPPPTLNPTRAFCRCLVVFGDEPCVEADRA